MDDRRLERIEGKIDVMMVEQAKQHVILASNVKQHQEIERDLAPIKKHVARIQGAVQLVTLLGILAGIVEAVLLIVK